MYPFAMPALVTNRLSVRAYYIEIFVMCKAKVTIQYHKLKFHYNRMSTCSAKAWRKAAIGSIAGNFLWTVKTFIACLHDQNKSGIFEGPACV